MIWDGRKGKKNAFPPSAPTGAAPCAACGESLESARRRTSGSGKAVSSVTPGHEMSSADFPVFIGIPVPAEKAAPPTVYDTGIRYASFAPILHFYLASPF